MSPVMDTLRKSTEEMKRSIVKTLNNLNDLYLDAKIRLGIEKRPLVIPESWLKPEQKWDTPMNWLFDERSTPAGKNPVARNPVFSFNIPKKDFSFLRSNLAFKGKRTMMFFLLVACIISMVTFTRLNPLSLLFYIPYTYICLDYLRKTRPKKRSGWLLLDDIEKD